jgi:hypothetical protein
MVAIIGREACRRIDVGIGEPQPFSDIERLLRCPYGVGTLGHDSKACADAASHANCTESRKDQGYDFNADHAQPQCGYVKDISSPSSYGRFKPWLAGCEHSK